MARLILSVIWTVFATGICIGLFLQERDAGNGLLVLALMVVFLLFGLVFMWDSVRRLRRRNSVRKVRENGADTYVWIEFDGTERRSRRDPREEWDAADGDGDGGGDGGGD